MSNPDSQNHPIFSSDDNKWETPQELFDLLDAEFHFTVDVCALASNTTLASNTKCDRFFSPSDDGLQQKWIGTCWMNPPYGKLITGKWLKKAWEASQSGATVVCLLPSRTDTRWFHDWVIGKASIRFINGRLRFRGFNGKGNHGDFAPFPSMIVIYDGKPTQVGVIKRPSLDLIK